MVWAIAKPYARHPILHSTLVVVEHSRTALQPQIFDECNHECACPDAPVFGIYSCMVGGVRRTSW
jgi:hypothetical protein